jgi:membrane-anchored protein YejM (alkaline phosphatase superfamily)
LLNGGIALVVAHGFVAFGGARPSWQAMLYAHLAFAAAIFTAVLALGGILVLLTILPRGSWVVLGLGPLLVSGLLAFLLIDRTAFRMYRFHVGGLVWSAVLLPGGLAELGVWPTSTIWLAATLAATVAFEVLALRWFATRQAACLPPTRPAPWWRWLVVGALTVVVLERTCLLTAERSGQRDVVRMASVVPFYPTLAGDIWLGLAGSSPVHATPAPRALPVVRFARDAPRWNVLWIVLDSWRADAMTPDLTPTVWALGRDGAVFRSHTSGSNSTRCGLVSMLYGLPASSWPQLELERRSPPLLATLRARGWDLGVFTSIALPDILAGVFADVPEASRIAAPAGRASTKDHETLSALEQFVAAPRAGRPFFAFVHFISTHLPYDPSCRLPGTARSDRERYERAVRCADRLIARAVAAVSLTDTLVVVTADHGEAFGEQGMYGHNSGFTLAQLRVPLVLHVPGRTATIVERPTSHHALPATILRELGAEPSAADGIGQSLFTDAVLPWVFACTENECAIHDADGSVTFSTGTRYPSGLEIRNPEGTRQFADGDLGRRRFAQVLEFLAFQRATLP